MIAAQSYCAGGMANVLKADAVAGARGHDLYLDFLGKLFNDMESFPDMLVNASAGATLHVHRFFVRARLPNLGVFLSWVQVLRQ